MKKTMKLFRFLYINCYAFLLAGIAAGIFFAPMNIFLLLLKILIALWCMYSSIFLFAQWKSKARKMPLLAARNKKELRPDTFKELTRTFCGRQMVNLTLADLRKTEAYRDLSAEEWKAAKRKALGKRGKPGRQKTAVGSSK